MVFALRNYNEEFLKHALRHSFFGVSLLASPAMIDEFLSILK